MPVSIFLNMTNLKLISFVLLNDLKVFVKSSNILIDQYQKYSLPVIGLSSVIWGDLKCYHYRPRNFGITPK